MMIQTIRCALVASLFLVLMAARAFAQSQYQDVAPNRGPWKDRPPGTYVVTKQTTREKPGAALKTEFQREVLLGADQDQRPWCAVYTSASADGPWEYKFGHGGGGSYGGGPESKLLSTTNEMLQLGDRA